MEHLPHTAQASHWRPLGMSGVFIACAIVIVAAALIGCASVPGTGASSPGATASATAHAGGQLAVRACPGSTGAVLSSKPGVILTQQQERQTIQASVGELIEVRLPATYHWDAYTANAGPALSSQQPQGSLDSSLNACVWDFAAVARGDITLQFTGGALCAPDAPCPMYAILADFTLHIG